MIDDIKYNNLQLNQQQEWESVCILCGACCGVYDEDPCEHLIQLKSQKYHCKIYKDRFGKHKTSSGRTIKCVPIRKILYESWPGDGNCAYKMLLKN